MRQEAEVKMLRSVTLWGKEMVWDSLDHFVEEMRTEATPSTTLEEQEKVKRKKKKREETYFISFLSIEIVKVLWGVEIWGQKEVVTNELKKIEAVILDMEIN